MSDETKELSVVKKARCTYCKSEFPLKQKACPICGNQNVLIDKRRTDTANPQRVKPL